MLSRSRQMPIGRLLSLEGMLSSGFCLLDTYTCFDHINHIIAQLFAFLHDIHVHGAHGIGLEMVVHIIYILTPELVALVINLIFYVERPIRIVTGSATFQS